MSSANIVDSPAAARRGIPRSAEAGLSGLGIVLCSPLLFAVAIAVRLTSPGPVLFRQPRMGLGGREFTMLKFRTMRVNQDPPGATATGDARITPVGRWLRRFKLDELPELWNIVRGDMSLVGPRPEVPRLVDLSNPAWRAVLSTRPGITDPVTLRLRHEEKLLASVPGSAESFYRDYLQPYKLKEYLEYQKVRSIGADIGVILRTLGAVFIPGAAPPPSIESIRAAVGTSVPSTQPGSRK